MRNVFLQNIEGKMSDISSTLRGAHEEIHGAATKATKRALDATAPTSTQLPAATQVEEEEEPKFVFPQETGKLTLGVGGRKHKKRSSSKTHKKKKKGGSSSKSHKKHGKKHKKRAKSHKKKKGGFKKGSASKTRKGRKDFVTHKGDKKYNRRGHRQSKNAKGKRGKPYSHRRKGGCNPCGCGK